MIKQRIANRISTLKIRTKFSLLLLTSGLLCIVLFQFLWGNKWNAWGIFNQTLNRSLHIFSDLDPDLWTNMQTEALKYNIPDSEDDTEAVEKMESFFDLADDYTAIYIYGIIDGKYRAGKAPSIMKQHNFRTAFDLGYQLTDGTGEAFYELPIQFKNGYAKVLIYSYHRAMFVLPYGLFCIILCILLFFGITIFFINRKMLSVISLKQHILQMASGDLDTPIPSSSNDELGILARELNHLRLTLSENFHQEEVTRQANQDLITALSHDLRTPLTILNGYLEVLRLKRNPDMEDEYLHRCLQKTEDIREMTNRMFEYALVFEKTESVNLTVFSADTLVECLYENADFIRLAGFETMLSLPTFSCNICCDQTMLKRICNNLFSNIIKYGSKKEPVMITGSKDSHMIKIVLRNAVKSEHAGIESTQIGLKSVDQMMTMMDGEFSFEQDNEYFNAVLTFHLH